MKHIVVFVALFSILIIGGCSQKKEQPKGFAQRIELLQDSLYNADGVLSADKANELIGCYEALVDSMPTDTMAPQYLFIAADLSINLSNVDRTVRLLDKIITTYPQSDKTGLSLFLKAFVYEEQLNDTATAKKYYEQFITEYPEHDFIDDAHIALQNMGKSPEELIRSFEEMNEE
ncbi:MAG: tetratricopeptide repeat protein [Bacteroidales bacterium]|nr:tetratricopeptide repeat protein [Bacteroidales bacterium]